MIVRRWSDWVVAAYEPDPDNPFGGRLIYVADRRETLTPQGDSNVGSWENVSARRERANAQTAGRLDPDDADRSPRP